MSIALRPYQEEIIERVRAEFRVHRSVGVTAPTGAGKTAIAAYMIAKAAERGRRAWMVVHRDFLITQTAAAFDLAGVPYGYIAANREFNPYHGIQIASIDTLRRRLDRLAPPDLIVWDECHHIAARSWGTVAKWASLSRHVGLSATFARLDGRGLGAFFGSLVRGPSVAWLSERGFLSRYRAFAPGGVPDLSSVTRRAGDYAAGELAAVMDTGHIAGNIVGQYKARANGKRAIYYAVSVDHSRHLVYGFQAAGVAGTHLDSQSTDSERIRAARDFADGSIRVICNVDLLGEGFDLSASAGRDASVEAVGLCRPTQSLTLHLQQCGRALRPKPEPAIILDHAGNLMRHGLPDDEREWSLDAKPARAKDRDDGAPVRMCERCYGVFGAATRICPYCGAVAPLTPREVEEIQADLVEADRELLKAARQREVQRAKTLEELIALGIARGYNNPAGWAKHKLDAKKTARQRYRSGATRPSPDLRETSAASRQRVRLNA